MKILIHSFFSQLKRFTLYRKLVLSFMTLLAVFSLLSSDFLAPFFASPAGYALLAVALGMQVAAEAIRSGQGRPYVLATARPVRRRDQVRRVA